MFFINILQHDKLMDDPDKFDKNLFAHLYNDKLNLLGSKTEFVDCDLPSDTCRKLYKGIGHHFDQLSFCKDNSAEELKFSP